MYSCEELVENIKYLGVKKDDVLLVHSSMKAIGDVEGGADTVIDALMEAVSEGMLILPAHTWATMNENHNIYDYKTEPACVGIIPNLFLKRKGVLRSLHPTHSVAAWSKNSTLAEQYVAGEENQITPCARNGCYGKLYDINAKILLLGVGLNKNTYMHGVEEWHGIKERLTNYAIPLDIKMPDGSLKPVQMHKHYKPDNISVSEYYVKMETPFSERGALVKGNIGDAHSMLMSAVKVADITTEYLEKERDVFLYI